MRGDGLMRQAPVTQTVQEPTPSTEAAGVQPNGGSNMEENTKSANNSIYWWVALLFLYIGWDVFQNHSKVKDSIKPANLRANAHNLALVSIAAVIGINGLNVLLTKLSAMRIPLISRLAGTFLPLFHL